MLFEKADFFLSKKKSDHVIFFLSKSDDLIFFKLFTMFTVHCWKCWGNFPGSRHAARKIFPREFDSGKALFVTFLNIFGF